MAFHLDFVLEYGPKVENDYSKPKPQASSHNNYNKYK